MIIDIPLSLPSVKIIDGHFYRIHCPYCKLWSKELRIDELVWFEDNKAFLQTCELCTKKFIPEISHIKLPPKDKYGFKYI